MANTILFNIRVVSLFPKSNAICFDRFIQYQSFASHRKVMLFGDVQFFIFQTTPLTLRIVISWWILALEAKYIFEYIFWIENHPELGRPIVVITDNVLGNILYNLEDWVFNIPFYQNKSENKHDESVVFYYVLRYPLTASKILHLIY